MSGVGAVAIGRNEGDRLRHCLASLAGRARPVVYVDSGSSDGSAELARSMGVEVVALDMGRPFSAARGRNAGFERLAEVDPAARYVMFVDGDCEVADGWLDRAARELDARPDCAVVFGRRREKHPDRSVYNRLADLEWGMASPGEVGACGGDVVVRAEAFRQVGGYDPTVPAGEEPELCHRLRLAGWRIWAVEAEMTRHDIAMTRFRQWWRRNLRAGYSGLDVATRFARPGGDDLFRRMNRSVRTWAVGWPLAVLAAGAAGGVIGGPRWGLGAALAVASALPAQVARVAWKARRRVDGARTALAHGVLTLVGKWAMMAGQVAYLRDRRRGRGAALVEYKLAGRPEGEGAGAAP